MIPSLFTAHRRNLNHSAEIFKGSVQEQSSNVFQKIMHKAERQHMRRNSNNFQGLDHFVKKPLQVKDYQQPSIVKVLRDRYIKSRDKGENKVFFAKDNSLLIQSKFWEDKVPRPEEYTTAQT